MKNGRRQNTQQPTLKSQQRYITFKMQNYRKIMTLLLGLLSDATCNLKAVKQKAYPFYKQKGHLNLPLSLSFHIILHSI